MLKLTKRLILFLGRTCVVLDTNPSSTLSETHVLYEVRGARAPAGHAFWEGSIHFSLEDASLC